MLDEADRNDRPVIGLNLDERATRALHSAVVYTLEKWAGEGKLDQEELLNLKTFLQGAVFEFQLLK